ncbi:MAG: nonstructural protein [Microvirus sp.]|nr:MAG: nonstructural protein [Microvirus sp.]
MKNQIFTVYDSKAAAFLQPFFSPTVQSGQRAFAQACSDPATMLHQYSSDYILWHIGSFDDVTGDLLKLEAPANLGLATQYKGAQS